MSEKNIREEGDAKAAEAAIQALDAFYAAIKMSANLREAGVKEEDLEVIAEKAVEDGEFVILAALGKDEVLEILQAAF